MDGIIREFFDDQKSYDGPYRALWLASPAINTMDEKQTMTTTKTPPIISTYHIDTHLHLHTHIHIRNSLSLYPYNNII